MTCPGCSHEFTPTRLDYDVDARVLLTAGEKYDTPHATLDVEVTLSCPECGAELYSAAIDPTVPLRRCDA
jgi:hypothetical protein